MEKIRDLENDALRRGETYITGQKYEGLSKGSIQLSGYISTGYAFAQDSGLYDLAMMAGLSYAGSKAKVSTPKKSSGTKPPKTDFGAENPVSGKDWNNYFKDKYGAGNVQWKPTSFDDIIANPERLYGSTKNEVKSVLGSGWIEDTYGSAGNGWKFINKGDGMIFYHPGEGIHVGSYYGFSSGTTGRVKVIRPSDNYVPTLDDGATLVIIE